MTENELDIAIQGRGYLQIDLPVVKPPIAVMVPLNWMLTVPL